MFPIRNCSLLNQKILAFYQAENEEYNFEDASKYFNHDGAFKAHDIINKLFPEKKNLNGIINELSAYTYNEFLECYIKLLPIFRQSKSVANNLVKSDINHIKYHWMGTNSRMYKILHQNKDVNNITNTVQQVLILTSLLENALANIYFTETQGKQPPHLLKDLLSTKEVQKVFGMELIIILKILMGSPNAINIRNVVWHGFPKPNEVPAYYENTLLIVIHSLGLTIENANYKIMERPLIKDFGKYLNPIDATLKTDTANILYYENKINEIENNFAKDFIPYWQQLFSYYSSKRYIELVVLILPQIELLLRLHYGRINAFDISAKLDEYYITMDTIFELDIMSSKTMDENTYQVQNKILDFTLYPSWEGCFHLIYDIFLSPNGCRLRDKVSHGEVELTSLMNAELVSLIFHIFLNLLTPLKCITLNNYESKLHLNCLTQQQLLETLRCLQSFNKNILQSSLIPCNEISKSVTSKVLIFKRPKKESEMMLLIKKISTNIHETLDNYKESLETRSKLLAQRDLHSKRRKTLEKLQNNLPEIFKTLHIMWRSINKLFLLLQTNYDLVLVDTMQCTKTLRFLKHSLTISENFAKYSHCDSNEWIKSLELCRKYRDYQSKLFLYDD